MESLKYKNYKICLIGNSGTGKTLLFKKMCHLPNSNPEDIVPTDDCESFTQNIHMNGMDHKVTLSTIAGSRVWDLLKSPLVTTADVIVFVCDINDFKSLVDIEMYYYELLKAKLSFYTFIIANKANMPLDQMFPIKEVTNMGKKIGSIKCYDIKEIWNDYIHNILRDIVQTVANDLYEKQKSDIRSIQQNPIFYNYNNNRPGSNENESNWDNCDGSKCMIF